MTIKKYKLIFAAVVIIYSFLMLFHPLLHSHSIDAKDHEDCFACSWESCVQIISNTPEIILVIVFLMGALFLPLISSDRIILSSFSSRAPPVPA
jgi:hypothetical protein